MLVRPIKVSDGDVLLVPGDIHFDKHDPWALDLMLQVAQAFRVNTIVLVGDTFESAGISRHGRPARKFRGGAATVEAEKRAAQPWFERMEALVYLSKGRPGGLHMLTGNHEAWWRLVQDDYPGLLDTQWFDLYGDLLNGWHVYDESTSLRFGPLLVCHGHRLRGSLSKYSAASVLANYPGQNTLYGHTHRIDSCTLPTYKYGIPQDHGAWTMGHLRDIYEEVRDPVIGPHAERHKQGFALVSFHEIEGEVRFKVTLVDISRAPNGRPYCVVGGQLFE